MLKLIGFCIRKILFAILILILGNTVHWDGRTLSEQVRLTMASTERSEWMDTLRGWAKRVTVDAQKGIQKKADTVPTINRAAESDEIPSSEKQKLRALIRELNTSRKN